MYFEILRGITDVEIIAAGPNVRSRRALNKRYGAGKWRKLKGRADVRLKNGKERIAEVHW